MAKGRELRQVLGLPGYAISESLEIQTDDITYNASSKLLNVSSAWEK